MSRTARQKQPLTASCFSAAMHRELSSLRLDVTAAEETMRAIVCVCVCVCAFVCVCVCVLCNAVLSIYLSSPTVSSC